MTLVLVAGSTATAAIDGISAAGADPEAMAHTPAADLELVEYGDTVFAGEVPVSPTGCPTPALITRAVRELLEFDVVAVESGLMTRTAAPTVVVGEAPGDDLREPEPVPDAEGIFERARTLGRELSPAEVMVGESIPGGTTTALGVLRALGEPYAVSSSLPENPLSRKERLVESGLDASALDSGEADGSPLAAVEHMGDPVLPAVMGLAVGCLESGTRVTLAGGTQMLAAGALVRHFGVDAPLSLATTVFVARATPDLRRAADALDIELTVTDPRFDEGNHVAMERYCRGEAKEGVGMGGVLALADRSDIPMGAVRERIVDRYEALLGTGVRSGGP